MDMITMPVKIADNKEFMKLVEKAKELKLNRQTIVERDWLQPNGVHVIQPVLIHRHAHGEPAPAHYRCICIVAGQNTLWSPGIGLSVVGSPVHTVFEENDGHRRYAAHRRKFESIAKRGKKRTDSPLTVRTWLDIPYGDFHNLDDAPESPVTQVIARTDFVDL